jgi:GxxExxY protein
MNADMLNALSERIIGCAFTVANGLGSGFLERVYENALAHELRKAGFAVAQQQGVSVIYDDVIVGEYAADLLVEAAVVVELKAVRALDDVHQAQCMNYLRATGMHLCLLLNFGRPRLEIRRRPDAEVAADVDDDGADRATTHLGGDLFFCGEAREARRHGGIGRLVVGRRDLR